MSNEIIDEMEHNISLLQDERWKIAELKEQKILKRAKSWENATGTAKEKEDYVRSVVAELDKEIAIHEANIEYLYNLNALLNDKLVFIEDE